MLSEFVISEGFRVSFGVMISSVGSVKFGRGLSKRTLFFCFYIMTAAV